MIKRWYNWFHSWVLLNPILFNYLLLTLLILFIYLIFNLIIDDTTAYAEEILSKKVDYSNKEIKVDDNKSTNIVVENTSIDWWKIGKYTTIAVTVIGGVYVTYIYVLPVIPVVLSSIGSFFKKLVVLPTADSYVVPPEYIEIKTINLIDVDNINSVTTVNIDTVVTGGSSLNNAIILENELQQDILNSNPLYRPETNTYASYNEFNSNTTSSIDSSTSSVDSNINIVTTITNE